MHVPAISLNIIVIAVLIGGMLFGALGGKHRLKLLILSIYVGIVFATDLAAIVVSSIHQPVDVVTLGLFALPILVFGLVGHRVSKHEHHGAMLANLVVGLAAGMLIMASALKVLPPSEAHSLAEDSLLATLLMQYDLWLIALLPVVALLLGLIRPKEKK